MIWGILHQFCRSCLPPAGPTTLRAGTSLSVVNRVPGSRSPGPLPPQPANGCVCSAMAAGISGC
eukprot:9482909-Pyramimonas_sp.AAC.1